MNWRTTVVLLVLVAALAGAYFLLQKNAENQPASPTAVPETKLFDIQESNVVSFTVQDQASGQTTELVREGSGWKFTQPASLNGVAADAQRVQTATSRFATMTAVQTLTGTVDLNVTGLVSPTHKITVNIVQDNNSQVHTLLVGKKSFDSSGYIVRRDSEPSVYLITAAYIDDLNRVLTNPPLITPSPTPTMTSVATDASGTPEPAGTVAPGSIPVGTPIAPAGVATPAAPPGGTGSP